MIFLFTFFEKTSRRHYLNVFSIALVFEIIMTYDLVFLSLMSLKSFLMGFFLDDR
jgi:hypothetical protein